MDKAQITPRLVSQLVAAQFPQWAELAVAPVEIDGNDNTTFRLGEELSVRLPSADEYVPQVEKEHRWLPVLAPQLPLPIPEPVGRGEPALGFPRPWSIYRWRTGEPATADGVDDATRFAIDLAGFLSALQAIDATGGPMAGAHSFFRGASLAAFDADARRAFDQLRDDLDLGEATSVWEAALATEWRRPPVWVHGDITGSNLLVAGGRLHAVLDFGCSAVGDPACDLAIAWTFFTGESREAFQHGLPLDGDTWARGRGWALWKAATSQAHHARSGNPTDERARRFGWRLSSRGVLDEVLGSA